MKKVRLAIAGATGAVGSELLKVLRERDFPLAGLTLLASARSVGKHMPWGDESLPVRELTADSFSDADIAIFSAGASRSRTFAPAAVAAGSVVVDNSSAYRMEAQVPLVVPEVNPSEIANHRGIIANPNCSTIIMVVPVHALHRVNPVRRVVVSTYQAISGAGQQAMLELEAQTADVLAGKPATPKALPHQCAFNIFSHNSAVAENGYNDEENKMIKETRKILRDDSIQITATCIRVPVLRAHSESINLTFDRPMTAAEAREILSDTPGVKVVDDRTNNRFPMPIEASGGDDILVGRIRQDVSQPDGRGIDLFVSGDQLRKGAALNAVQIAEYLLNGVM